jgi:tetratricopeptide (TPR) repeat protein
MGDVYDEMGDFSRATEAYEKAVQIRRDYWSYVNLGRVYEKLERTADARTSYQEALKIDTQGKEARISLFVLDHPDVEELNEEMNQVVKDHPFLDDPVAVSIIYEEAKRRKSEREKRELERKQAPKRLGLN